MNSDCISDICSMGVCIGNNEPTCDDGIKNGFESGLDCGGYCGFDGSMHLFEPDCEDGNHCWGDADCVTFCEDAFCGGVADALGCSSDNATDLGIPGNMTTVMNDDCVSINTYPSWWGTRGMQVQSSGALTYPLTAQVGQECTGLSQNITLPSSWGTVYVGITSDECPTIITLKGNGSESINLTYYGM